MPQWSIVVVEAVHAKLDQGYDSSLTAAIDAMNENYEVRITGITDGCYDVELREVRYWLDFWQVLYDKRLVFPELRLRFHQS